MCNNKDTEKGAFMDIVDILYDNLKENKSFHIIANKDGRITFDAVVPASKLYDITKTAYIFFDIQTGLQIEICINNPKSNDWDIYVKENEPFCINVWNHRITEYGNGSLIIYGGM